MAEPGALDYFYGTEAEQYTFYRIPKVLFTDPGFRRITADAKILYGLMLDRMGLSIRNGWLDEQERVFIYFTLEGVPVHRVGQGGPDRAQEAGSGPTHKNLRQELHPERGSQDFRKPELLTSENRTQSILIIKRLI